MKVLLIFLKEMKHNVRNFKSNVMMILFPILLIIILGAAFKGAFDSTINLGDVQVLYTIDENAGDPAFRSAFSSFCKGMSDETGIEFIETNDIAVGMAGIEDNRYNAYFHITGDPIRVDMYKNERRGYSASIVENALGSFLDTYVTMSVIARNNPAALSQQSSGRSSHVMISSIDRKRQPSSTDYYSITMLTLILLYSSLTGFWGIRNEKEEKTAARILCSPTFNYQLMTGKVLGDVVVTLLQGLVVILFSSFILKAYWGENPFAVALLITSYSIMPVSMGVALAYLMKSSEAASGVLNTIIPIMAFLGGGYVPLSVMGEGLSKISDISPVKWVNSALFNVIFDGSNSGVAEAVGINLGIALLFITLSAILSRRNKAYA
ncbi:MAG: ABC transporter permease [Clostridiaceae bacterium]|nr:ABC transporter permease [Clostridiaceae bacterium]